MSGFKCWPLRWFTVAFAAFCKHTQCVLYFINFVNFYLGWCEWWSSTPQPISSVSEPNLTFFAISQQAGQFFLSDKRWLGDGSVLYSLPVPISADELGWRRIFQQDLTISTAVVWPPAEQPVRCIPPFWGDVGMKKWSLFFLFWHPKSHFWQSKMRTFAKSERFDHWWFDHQLSNPSTLLHVWWWWQWYKSYWW